MILQFAKCEGTWHKVTRQYFHVKNCNFYIENGLLIKKRLISIFRFIALKITYLCRTILIIYIKSERFIIPKSVIYFIQFKLLFFVPTLNITFWTLLLLLLHHLFDIMCLFYFVIKQAIFVMRYMFSVVSKIFIFCAFIITYNYKQPRSTIMTKKMFCYTM